MGKYLKQFELWFEKKKVGYSHTAYYTDKYEDGWKAALEWVENELDKAREGFEPDLGLRNLLKKELKGIE